LSFGRLGVEKKKKKEEENRFWSKVLKAKHGRDYFGNKKCKFGRYCTVLQFSKLKPESLYFI
jgi:hypothetical protein